MPNIKFTYFDTRGLGEPARLILHHAKVPFDDVRVTQEQWPKLKPTFKTGKIPCLEYDGHQLSESYAINRFLARKYGLAGKDEIEQALVDSIADVQKDFYYGMAPWFYNKLGFAPGDAAELREKHFVVHTANYLPIFTKFLKESGSGFLVKSGLTWADFVLTEFLFSLKKLEPEVLKDYPELQSLVDHIQQVPELKDYYKNRNWG
ncbi:hypothetical protein FO519_001549 [Halicephalobus sp. NKZ332]|nr:hypothetical protein FO519_001549 [Halicephalobus sp. NKZ332]